MGSATSAPPLSGGKSGPLLFDLGSLADRLPALTDTRQPRGKRDSLALVLLRLILAKLAGEDRLSGIGAWVQGRRVPLCAALHLPRPTMPHPNTFRRILSTVVSPTELETLVQEFFPSLPTAGRSVLVAIDGKAVRGTITAANPRGEHLWCAYLPAEGLVLLQVAAGAKEDESSVAPTLLASLDLRHTVVMGDALHPQRALAVQILAAGGDDIWLAKDNQPTLRQDIADLFPLPSSTVLGGQIPMDFRTARTVGTGHGRRETRQITVSSALAGYGDGPGIAQVFQRDRARVDRRTGHVAREVVHGRTSLSVDQASPQHLLEFVRSYGGVENGLHQRRDGTFREDATRLTVGQAGRVLAIPNNLVIGLLRRAGYTNLAHARRILASNVRAALKLLAAHPQRL